MNAAERQALAAKWQSSERTIKRWAREGAPLGSDSKMAAWLAGRKNVPPAVKAGLPRAAKPEADTHEPVKAVAQHERVIASSGTGAPAALKRLEQAEFAAFETLQRAILDGDQYTVKVARENWIKIGDSLRRYDILVARERRESGEMVQRTDCELHVRNFVRVLKLAINQTCHAVAPSVEKCSAVEASSILRSAMWTQICSAAAILAAKKCPGQPPDWLVRAALAPMDDSFDEATEETLRWIELLRTHNATTP